MLKSVQQCTAMYIVAALLLTGCTAGSNSFAIAAAKQAATAADNALEASEWHWCNAATSGAEKRRYGPLKKKWDARMEICWPELVQ